MGARIAMTVNRLRGWLVSHRVELNLTLRVSISAVLSLAVAQFLNLPVALWAVLTAVVLTQMNVGRSLKATTDYLTGTLGAAIYAGAVGAIVPHASETSYLVALAIAIAPPALFAAINPRFSAAPFTAALVFLAPSITHAGPVAAAVERIVEVAVGGLVGLTVSLLVFPARAQGLATEAAAQMLDLMARWLPTLFTRLATGPADTPNDAVQDAIGEAFVRFETVAEEAKQERAARLMAEPDLAPLLRTLLRLRHDLVIVGRAGLVPLPESFAARLGSWPVSAGEAAAVFLRNCGDALLAQRGAPPLDGIAALDGYAAAVAAFREEGIDNLSPGAVGRIFALGFALDQMRANCRDLARCVDELAPAAGHSRTAPHGRRLVEHDAKSA